MSPSPILVLFGSGPGIARAVAKRFTRDHFDTIVLTSRNSESLATEKKEVESAAKQAGRDVKVHTFISDLSDIDALGKTLKEIEKLGPLGCVYHNAARIRVSDPLTAPAEELLEDFKVRISPPNSRTSHERTLTLKSDKHPRPLRNRAMGHSSPAEEQRKPSGFLRHQLPPPRRTRTRANLPFNVQGQPTECNASAGRSFW